MTYTYGQSLTGRQRAARKAADKRRAERRRHLNLIRSELMLADPQEVIAEAGALAAYLRYMKPEDEPLGQQRLQAAAAEAYGRAA